MRTISWRDGELLTIDQSSLPSELRWLRLRNSSSVISAIETMKIRGAPVIGVAAAYALALEADHLWKGSRDQLLKRLERTASLLKKVRPTGRNLSYAVDRVIERVQRGRNLDEAKLLTIKEAQRIAGEEITIGRRLTEKAQTLVRDGDTILTHCNSGELATVQYGTALGAIIRAWKRRKRFSVIATETRPLLQGARLTAWELKRAGVPFRLITDSMVGYVLSQKMVNKVMVGADRVWGDGTVANKIGTLTIAITANQFKVPFYVVAPISSFDFEGKPDSKIIEQRDPDEVLTIFGRRMTPRRIEALNPAFDITPARYISAIATEYGIIRPPFREALKQLRRNHVRERRERTKQL